MKRLLEGLGENSAEGYDAIYAARKDAGVDPMDLKRWKRLLKYYKGGKLIDIGCLDSLVPQLALEWYPKAEVWGIDVAAEAIKQLQEEDPRVLYKVQDAYHNAFPNNYFDYAVAGEVMEHLDDPQAFLKETFRVLKHGGILALSVPENEEAEPGAKDIHRHVWSYQSSDIINLTAPYGSVLKTQIMGSQYFPSYIYSWPNIIAFIRKA